MPRRPRTITCVVCGEQHTTLAGGTRTCSHKCGAILREREHPRPVRAKRVYPAAVIKKATKLYRDGMTVAEVQTAIGSGYKAQLILERYLPARRSTAKRDQYGERNDSWRGDSAGYDAVHARLKEWFGPASTLTCADCGVPAHDWSYCGTCDAEQVAANGCSYCSHPEHYAPRCVSCHRKFDAAMRAARRNGGDVNV